MRSRIILLDYDWNEFLTVLSFIFSFRQWGVLPHWVSYAGDALIIVGMVIRFSTIIQLGSFFSLTVEVVANQELIQSGWYRWIRNPSYTGGWLIAVGIGLGLRTWWGTLLSGVGSLLIYAYRIHVEEKAMIQLFEDKYLHYMERTKKMFPGIW